MQHWGSKGYKAVTERRLARKTGTKLGGTETGSLNCPKELWEASEIILKKNKRMEGQALLVTG